MEKILSLLFSKQDLAYCAFQAPLIPNLDKDLFIGVRLPELKKMAKEIGDKEFVKEFIKELPHHYYDENQLHAFVIANIKDYETCLKEVERFLPYIDNWAVCDTLKPNVFKKNKTKLINRIKEWLSSDHIYTQRFAIGQLMSLYLNEEFKEEYLELVSHIRSEEYYLNMMIAWYFATALAKQYDATIKYMEAKKLSTWVHNKAIQKALESYRVSDEHKEYLRSLKITKKPSK